MVYGNKIITYNDLDVYQRSYKASILVMKEILPKLPENEKFDLKDQLSRSCKAIPRLIAEGFAKKHQKAGFQKYIDDAMSENNETQVSLCQCRDIYPKHIDDKICSDLIKEYEIIGKQLFKLGQAWDKFTKPNTQNQKPNLPLQT